MTSFDDRKKGFENKFVHDEDLRFRITARGHKLLGYWAAELLGKTGDAAEDYAKEVVRSDFEEAGHEDVFRKVAGDLGDLADEPTIRGKMMECNQLATAQIMDKEDG